eukprot:NODE_14017_length_236_cov_211.276243.p1 GENE.NODE_14017_length_236_cov_211.276243~~NODE_14017_length_236_cov_211.276243.p1  ORF type:complete len:70 (-),score=6.49 NODE_14017_length_236_cov_211.276243:25-234(-)
MVSFTIGSAEACAVVLFGCFLFCFFNGLGGAQMVSFTIGSAEACTVVPLTVWLAGYDPSSVAAPSRSKS